MGEGFLRKLDLIVAPLILVSIVSLALGSNVDADTDLSRYLIYLEVALSILFAIEYGIRFYFQRWRYTFSFFGIIDLIAILPGLLLIVGMTEFLSLRILRILRLISLLKIGRYSNASHELWEAIKSVREEFAILALVAAMVLCLAAFGIHVFEREAQPEHFATFGDCLWWAIISLTTVGYGDVFPITVGGKIFASVILLLCIGIIATPAGLIASAMTQARAKRE